jgi:hypothetical protein
MYGIIEMANIYSPDGNTYYSDDLNKQRGIFHFTNLSRWSVVLGCYKMDSKNYLSGSDLKIITYKFK